MKNSAKFQRKTNCQTVRCNSVTLLYLYNPGKIPEIKHIVRLGRCGQEAGDSLSINFSDGADYNLKEKRKNKVKTER